MNRGGALTPVLKDFFLAVSLVDIIVKSKRSLLLLKLTYGHFSIGMGAVAMAGSR